VIGTSRACNRLQEAIMQSIQNLVELYQWSCDQHAERKIFGTRRAGAWHWLTYREFGELVDEVRGGLAMLGVRPGDRIAYVGDNSVEWAVAAYAGYGLGAAFVPMYQAQQPSEWQFILEDSGARVAICGNEPTYQVLEAMRPGLPALRQVIGVARPDDAPGSWTALRKIGAARPVVATVPDPQQIAGFIYTSGTTGKPKGALLSHANIMSNVAAAHELWVITPDDRYLSFLPWAHAYGQTVELHMLLSWGASLAINDELPRLLDNLVEVKPTVLVAVPRIFHRIYDAMVRELAHRPGLAERITQALAAPRAPGELVALPPADRAVVQALRDHFFGGRLRYAFTGSAAISTQVIEFIDALGIEVYEGYGLTEASPVVTTNYPGARRFGSVGKALPGVRLAIDTAAASDPRVGERVGEIVVHGPNVMRGYHDRPDETAAALTADGGLRTGDLGYLDGDGYLFIRGRIKEQYKLENGKYVMPSPLEEELKLSPVIANVMIYGDGRPCNVALVVPDAQAVQAWANHQGVTLPKDATGDDRVRSLVGLEIERLSAGWKPFEKVRRFALIGDDFTVANGQLTPTLKLRRNEALARHGGLIDALYAQLKAM
jgi:long-chain acyl-CoA synthetase